MYVAPFGIVGFAKRIGRRIVQVDPEATVGRRRRRGDRSRPTWSVEEDKITSSPSDIALT